MNFIHKYNRQILFITLCSMAIILIAIIASVDKSARHSALNIEHDILRMVKTHFNAESVCFAQGVKSFTLDKTIFVVKIEDKLFKITNLKFTNIGDGNIVLEKTDDESIAQITAISVHEMICV